MKKLFLVLSLSVAAPAMAGEPNYGLEVRNTDGSLVFAVAPGLALEGCFFDGSTGRIVVSDCHIGQGEPQ